LGVRGRGQARVRGPNLHVFAGQCETPLPPPPALQATPEFVARAAELFPVACSLVLGSAPGWLRGEALQMLAATSLAWFEQVRAFLILCFIVLVPL
jgi:hypothetical protein